MHIGFFTFLDIYGKEHWGGQETTFVFLHFGFIAFFLFPFFFERVFLLSSIPLPDYVREIRLADDALLVPSSSSSLSVLWPLHFIRLFLVFLCFSLCNPVLFSIFSSSILFVLGVFAFAFILSLVPDYVRESWLGVAILVPFAFLFIVAMLIFREDEWKMR